MGLISIVYGRIQENKNYILKELSMANLLDTDDGDAIIAIDKILKSIHPGDREWILSLSKKLNNHEPISYLDCPLSDMNFIILNDNNLARLQSTRLLSLFSDDHGASWYDIDITPKFRWFWKPINKYLNLKWIQLFVKKQLLHYVEFPYERV